MREDSELIRRFEQIAVPICLAHGLEFVDARFQFDRGPILRVMIERRQTGNVRSNHVKENGVSLSDCQEITRDLLTALEVENEWKLHGDYRLEVSSPGLDRPLFKLGDFQRFEGNEVRIQTTRPVSGRKRFRGRLLNVEGENIRIEQDGAVVTIQFPTIAKANLIPDL
jgi:ribosome maturation factor RimP